MRFDTVSATVLTWCICSCTHKVTAYVGYCGGSSKFATLIHNEKLKLSYQFQFHTMQQYKEWSRRCSHKCRRFGNGPTQQQQQHSRSCVSMSSMVNTNDSIFQIITEYSLWTIPGTSIPLIFILLFVSPVVVVGALFYSLSLRNKVSNDIAAREDEIKRIRQRIANSNDQINISFFVAAISLSLALGIGLKGFIRGSDATAQQFTEPSIVQVETSIKGDDNSVQKESLLSSTQLRYSPQEDIVSGTAVTKVSEASSFGNFIKKIHPTPTPDSVLLQSELSSLSTLLQKVEKVRVVEAPQKLDPQVVTIDYSTTKDTALDGLSITRTGTTSANMGDSKTIKMSHTDSKFLQSELSSLSTLLQKVEKVGIIEVPQKLDTVVAAEYSHTKDTALESSSIRKTGTASAKQDGSKNIKMPPTDSEFLQSELPSLNTLFKKVDKVRVIETSQKLDKVGTIDSSNTKVTTSSGLVDSKIGKQSSIESEFLKSELTSLNGLLNKLEDIRKVDMPQKLDPVNNVDYSTLKESTLSNEKTMDEGDEIINVKEPILVPSKKIIHSGTFSLGNFMKSFHPSPTVSEYLQSELSILNSLLKKVEDIRIVEVPQKLDKVDNSNSNDSVQEGSSIEEIKTRLYESSGTDDPVLSEVKESVSPKQVGTSPFGNVIKRLTDPEFLQSELSSLNNLMKKVEDIRIIELPQKLDKISVVEYTNSAQEGSSIEERIYESSRTDNPAMLEVKELSSSNSIERITDPEFLQAELSSLDTLLRKVDETRVIDVHRKTEIVPTVTYSNSNDIVQEPLPIKEGTDTITSNSGTSASLLNMRMNENMEISLVPIGSIDTTPSILESRTTVETSLSINGPTTTSVNSRNEIEIDKAKQLGILKSKLEELQKKLEALSKMEKASGLVEKS